MKPLNLLTLTSLLFSLNCIAQVKVKINSNPIEANYLVINGECEPSSTKETPKIDFETDDELIVFKEGFYHKIIPIKKDSVFKSININLTPFNSEFPKMNDVLGFSKLIITIPKNKKIGQNGDTDSRFVDFWQDLFSKLSEYLINDLAQALTDNNVNISKEDNSLFETSNRTLPRFILAGEIYDMYFSRNGKNHYSIIYYKWEVLDTKTNKVVYSGKTEGCGFSDWVYAFESRVDAGQVGKSLYSAVRKLCSLPDFQAALTSEPKFNNNVSDVTKIEKLNLIENISKSELAKIGTESTVTIKTDFGHGSGVIISKDGYILTNYHVIDGAKEIEVVFSNGFALVGEVKKYDEKKDVALIQVKGAKVKGLPLNKNGEVNVGDEILVIGTPKDVNLGQSVSKGIISGKRELDGVNYFQTDASINNGNSGGPLINSKGQVVGLATLKRIDAEGIGMAITISEVMDILKIQFL